MKFDPKGSPEFLIGRTAHALREQVAQHLRQMDCPVSPEELAILGCLVQANRDLRIGELAEIAARDATTVKRQLNSLESHRLVSLHVDQTDRRAVLVLPTESGKKLIAETSPYLADLRAATLLGISDGECETLVHLLQQMHENLLQLSRGKD